MKQTFLAVLVLATPMLAQVVTINGTPSREFGQPILINPVSQLNSAAPNLVEGRELFSPTAIAFDASVSPPHVYIVDTGNNRVLGFSNANNLTQGNYADLVLGQPPSSQGGYDLTATFPLGPSTTLSTGLNSPTGIAVDAGGNVYVADSGNNRIVRFKAPYAQQPGNLIVDLVIGQQSIAATSASPNNQGNLGQQNPSSNSLYLSVANAGGIIAAGLAIDASGNLWAADPGNNRVLRFPASSLAAGTQLPVADTVLGQNSFTSNNQQVSSQTSLGALSQPTGVAVDGQGNLYVTDAAGRAIQYQAPVSSGQSGAKVLGVATTPAQGQTVSYPTSYTLGAINSSGGISGSPQGIFVSNSPQGASVYVCDSPQNRVVRYDTFNPSWQQVQAPNSSPMENGVIGQSGVFVTGKANQGMTAPTNSTFSYPVGGAINPSNNELWIVDQQNHRVVAFQSNGGTYSAASRVIGQTDFIYNSPNLIVGSELWLSAYPSFIGGGMVVDSTSNPPHLYVADTLNNRVLGFNDARNVGTDSRSLLTQKADLVIGQTDLLHSLINSPNNTPGQPTATGLYRPVGLAVDANGNLWVADSGNGRAVRFPAPFAAQAAGNAQTANVVLGQPDFVTVNPSVTQFNMVQPFGLALFASGSIAVSDATANRILVFDKPSGGDFNSGAQANLVVGQSGFNQAVAGSSTSNSGFNSPHGIAVDSSDRLYVCDYNNNRLMVFSKPTGNNPTAAVQVSVGQPNSVIVSFITGYSWITSLGSNAVYQLPEFQTLEATQAPTQSIASYGPVAVTLDQFDDVIVGDSANRLTFYFGQLFYRNTASFAAGTGTGAGPTPTMLIELARLGSNFSFTTSYGSGNIQNLAPPWPLTLNNVQVLVNGIQAPIFRIDPAVVDVEIPNEAPSSGPADFVVSDPTSGQILAVATFTMQSASPGIYTANSQGTGQVAANVYDSKGNPVGGSTPNGQSNPVAAGGIIGLWLTGAGNVSGLPADGVPPGSSQQFVPPGNLTVYIGGEVATVVGSAMSPQYPGVWQINAVVPADTASSSFGPVYVEVSLDDYASNIGGTTLSNGGPGPDQPLLGTNGLLTTIYVK